VDYDSYGTPITTSGGSTVTGGLRTATLHPTDPNSTTAFGFGGGYLDTTGLTYLVHRYYDPTSGQFVSVDPMVSLTGTPYSYAGDDAVDRTDAQGLWWCHSGRGGTCPHGYWSGPPFNMHLPQPRGSDLYMSFSKDSKLPYFVLISKDGSEHVISYDV
jgi:RHS repeat-associated protein